MAFLYSFVAIILVFVVAWCLLLLPNRQKRDWSPLMGYRYAHRGLHDKEKGIPENSMTAFRAAVDHGFGAELDVHLLADGNLAVFHDGSLKRVCGADVCIEDLTAADLAKYPLQGTEEHIPLLADVLAVFEGKTPLIIELKVERGNAAALTDATVEALRSWKGTYCMESFHPAAVYHLKKHHPQVIRGQLSQNFMKGSETSPLSPPLAFVMTHLLTTALTRPDFIAYKHTDRREVSLRLMKKLYAVREVSWTIRGEEELYRLEKEGCIPIFENFIPA